MKNRITLWLVVALCFLQANLLTAQGNQYLLKPGKLTVITDNGAYMGVYLESITTEKAKSLGFNNLYGSYIQKVIPGTPADRSGLRALDYIYGVDTYRTGSEQSLTNILERYHSGERATLHVQRGENRIDLGITFGSKREDRREISVTPCQDPFLGVMKESRGAQQGGIVVRVIKASTADKMGLQDGDEVLRINGYKILDWSDLSSAINDTEVGDKIEVVARRGNSQVKRAYPIQSRCAFEEARGRSEEYSVKGETKIYFDTETRSGGSHKLLSKSMDRGAVQRANDKYGLSLNTDQSLSVQDFYFSADFDKEVLEVSFELPERAPTNVRIYNTMGRVIYDFDLGDFSGTFKDRTNLLKNESGLYFLQIEQGKQSVVQKIEVRQ